MISVLMIAYNAAKTIRQAILSVKRQTHKDWELVIVDDGSVDDTVKIAESEKADNIRIISVPHGGVPKARNLSVASALGQFLATLDADDAYEPTYLEEFMRSYERDGWDVAYCDIAAMDADLALKVDDWKYPDFDKKALLEDMAKQGCARIPHGSMVIRKEAFADKLYPEMSPFHYDENLPVASDFERTIRLLEAEGTRWQHIPSMLYKMRLNPHSVSRSDRYMRNYCCGKIVQGICEKTGQEATLLIADLARTERIRNGFKAAKGWEDSAENVNPTAPNIIAGIPSDSMRIMISSDSGSIHTKRLAKWLADRGHSVAVFDPYFKEEFDRRVKCYAIPQGFPQPRSQDEVNALAPLALFYGCLDFKADVLQGCYVNGHGLWAFQSTYRPLVLTCWGSDVLGENAQAPAWKQVYNYMFNEADAVTADSKALVDEVNKISSRINHYVPLAIDSDRFTPETDTKPALDMLKGLDPSNTNIIISPRQWKQAGRIEAIVSSFKAILDRKMYPKEKCHAIFITYSTNGTEDHAKVKSFIEANLPSDSYSLFEDGVPWETMPAFLRLADCYVSAFRTDSNSCSLLESLSCGTPVVAVDNGNTAELRDKGWILESENPPSPLSLARDIQAAFGMARNRPFGLVEAFGLPAWEQFEAIYKECAKSARNAEWIDSYLEADSKVVLKPGKNDVPVKDALYLMRGMAYKSLLSGNINSAVSNVSGWLNIAANSKPDGTVTLSRQGAREPDGSASRT